MLPHPLAGKTNIHSILEAEAACETQVIVRERRYRIAEADELTSAAPIADDAPIIQRSRKIDAVCPSNGVNTLGDERHV
ncbi:hypothetical protein D9M72_479260 [compost metagenome]